LHHDVLTPAVTGNGLCILSCFIKDTEPQLVAVSDKITSLQSSRWLVSHDDDRHEKPIRQIADELAKLFKNLNK